MRLKRSLGSTEIHEFIANHPFVFFILDRQTDLMLFVARVVSPSGVGEHHDEL
jgi:serine protease inhibitor